MMQILVIEPDVVLAKTYQQALQKAGHQVDIADSAQQAVDKADEHHPDVILLELQLPNHNGVEFLYELRSYPEWQNIPVIILSSVPPNEVGVDEKVWQQLGVVNYFYKPRTSLRQIVTSLNRLAPKTA